MHFNNSENFWNKYNVLMSFLIDMDEPFDEDDMKIYWVLQK